MLSQRREGERRGEGEKERKRGRGRLRIAAVEADDRVKISSARILIATVRTSVAGQAGWARRRGRKSGRSRRQKLLQKEANVAATNNSHHTRQTLINPQSQQGT